ncbi:Protein of unknown function [Pyronema omphalodes CBS 100304]|uniref:Uncharacterized protein n=1 Tax=Pyronema omphalodes (strain CBS 100304) TaxID=1076935 RepID=U4KZ57_PYROM|nr:Protein of unknown function [Pyronema omphalodes CBS 100304]
MFLERLMIILRRILVGTVLSSILRLRFLFQGGSPCLLSPH